MIITYVGVIVSAWAIANVATADSDLASLPNDQVQTARCMLAVVKAEPGVTDATIRISESTDQPAHDPRVYIDYSYNHRTFSAPLSRQEIDITSLIASKEGNYALPGLVSPGASPDLNDNDDGMLSIYNGWSKKCRLSLSVLLE